MEGFNAPKTDVYSFNLEVREPLRYKLILARMLHRAKCVLCFYHAHFELHLPNLSNPRPEGADAFLA